ncbi:MAG TPA: TldD/PmbA family protein [Ktedonobacterales bacterium]
MNDTLAATLGDPVAELERRFPYAAVLLSGSSGMRINDTGGEQSANEVSPARGAVFTVYDGTAFQEYATGDLEPDTLARDVRAWAAGVTPQSGGAPPAIGAAGTAGSRLIEEFRTEGEVAPGTVPLREKLAVIRDVQQRLKALDPRIVQARVIYGDATDEKLYIGRGRTLRQRVTRTVCGVLAAVSDGAQVRFHFESFGGTRGFEMTRIGDEQLRAVADMALRLLEAGKIEPGEYDVVTDPSISGVIAHESFGHGVELDLFPKGRARAAQYLDRQVASPLLNMYDDPSYPGGYGSYFFDDEGELARPVQILRDGVFVRPISDLASATLAPGVHTPNGRRQDYSRKTFARMSNTFFAAGQTPPAQLFEGIERGVYLRFAQSGVEDPMGWGIQVTARVGEEIRDGALTGTLYAPVGISGYVPDVLMSVSAVGSDFELSGAATCGKGHKELVPVSSGGPHLRLKARLA